MNIDTEENLRIHLKVLKFKLLKYGYSEFQLYPMFCLMYDKNKARYQLSKEIVFDTACEILIEE